MEDFREKLIHYHNTGVTHNKAARDLVDKMEDLSTLVEEEKGLEEVGAPIKQVSSL